MFNFMEMETLLPFLLVVAVTYGAMETSGIFRNRAIKTIVAVVLALFAVTNYYIVQAINSMLPYVAIIFLLVFIAGFAKRSLSGSEKDNTMMIIMLALALLFIASIARAEGGFGLYEYTEFLWLVGVAVVVAVLYAAYRMK
jgi:hypothetical protein